MLLQIRNILNRWLIFFGVISVSLFLHGFQGFNHKKCKEFKLIFSAQPTNSFPAGTTDGVLAPITVLIVDKNGDIVQNAEHEINIAIAHNPGRDLHFLHVTPIEGRPATGTGVFAGLLVGTTTIRAVNGSATFSDLGITQLGKGYTLIAESKGVKSALSRPFDILRSKAGYEPTSENDGLEIADLTQVGANFQGYTYVYISYPPNPISPSAFETWSQHGWIQNTPRHPVFNYQRLLGSPDSTEESLTLYTDDYGYTWGYIAQIQNADWPFHPSYYPPPKPKSAWQAGATVINTPDGVVKYSYINKNQLYIYQAINPDTHQAIICYFLTDEWGNEYIMKSSNKENDTPEKILSAFQSAVLPSGWGKSIGYLPQNFYGYPIQNNLTQAYQDLRDSRDNAYTQIVWGKKGKSVPQQIGYPMPIYASNKGALVKGNKEGSSLMYGGISNDQFYPAAGGNMINGGYGTNGVFYRGNMNQYTIKRDGLTTYVKRKHAPFDTLTDIQYLHFTDKTIRTSQ